MIEHVLIDSTFKRIEKSLDLRFQKKGSFYISKEDSENIKGSLYLKEFQNLFAIGSKVGNPIIVQIILKNPWLITFNIKDYNDFNKEFKKLLYDGNEALYLRLSKDIVDDVVFSTVSFKGFVEDYYYNTIDLSSCEKIIDNKNNKASIKIICLMRHIVNSKDTGLLKIRYLEGKFNSDPDLYKTIKDTNYLNNFMQIEDEKYGMAEWLLDNKISSNADLVWIHAFVALSGDAFKVAREYVENHDDYSDDLTKYLVRKMFEKFLRRTRKEQEAGIGLDRYVDEMAELYTKVFSSKILFLEMLNPNKFKDKALAITLIDRFEEIGVPEKFKERIVAIREGSNGIDDKKFSSWQSAFEEINEKDLSNVATLKYLFWKIKASNFNIIVELYNQFRDYENVKLLLGYFFAKSLSDHNVNEWLEDNELQSNYINLISNYINEDNINHKKARDFLYKHNKHEILERFLER